MTITPKTFRAKNDLQFGRNSYKAGEEIPAGSYDLGRLLALGLVVEDGASKIPKTKTEEASDGNHQ